MDKVDRLYTLHQLFDDRRRGISLAQVCERLECSAPTAKRAIRELRVLLGAPLVHSAVRGGYVYERTEGEARVELPGLWFGPNELAALLTLNEVLSRLEPGLLGDALAPLTRRLSALLARKRLGLGEAARRIRVLSQHARAPGPAFGPTARALVDRRDLAFHYEARSDSASSDRRVSPQRLIRYRGCWYLDAWCHDRNALRTFALERMTNTRVLQDRARNLPESDLDAHYTAAYGVFSGPATATAVLRIEPGRARWVGDEEWHPQQSGAWLDDGCYELRVPYGRSEELILDILRLGADVEVVGPPELRAAVLARLQTAVGRYDEKRRKRDGTSKKVASVMD